MVPFVPLRQTLAAGHEVGRHAHEGSEMCDRSGEGVADPSFASQSELPPNARRGEPGNPAPERQVEAAKKRRSKLPVSESASARRCADQPVLRSTDIEPPGRIRPVRKPLLAAVSLAAGLLIGAGMPLYATETEDGREKCWSGAPEGSEVRVDGWSWWPVGTRCVLMEADGMHREKIVPLRGEPDWRHDT